MPSSSSVTVTRTARGAATRDRLLLAAGAEIIAGQGEMELAAVASRAGVSPGLPYRYFDSKSALLVAVVDGFFDALDDAVYRPAFSEVSDDWWERERVRIEKLVGFFYDEPLGSFVVSQLAGDAAVVQAQQRRVSKHVHGATANVKAGQKLKRVPAEIDAELAGALLIGGVHETMQQALARTPPMRRSRVVCGLQVFMRDVLQIEE